MDIHTDHIRGAKQISALHLGQLAAGTKKTPVAQPGIGTSFQEILDRHKTDTEVKFSKHAAVRLADRGISLTEDQLGRLNAGATKAGAKGIKDSLVIVDEMSFIVNIPNRTVVTALHGPGTADHVYTNIDGAVIT